MSLSATQSVDTLSMALLKALSDFSIAQTGEKMDALKQAKEGEIANRIGDIKEGEKDVVASTSAGVVHSSEQSTGGDDMADLEDNLSELHIVPSVIPGNDEADKGAGVAAMTQSSSGSTSGGGVSVGVELGDAAQGEGVGAETSVEEEGKTTRTADGDGDLVM